MRIICHFTVLVFLVLAPRVAFAAALSAQDRQDIARAEASLNGLHTFAANFIQTADSGETVTGALLVSRPGKMNLSYDPPLKDFIIADGSFVYMWDGELENSTTVPMGNSLADLILRANLRLTGDVEVTQVKRGSSTLEITVRQKDDPGNGSMTLLFEDNPLILHGWRVQDAQNRVTTVALQGLREGIDIPARSFTFVPPKLGKSAKQDKTINQ